MSQTQVKYIEQKTEGTQSLYHKGPAFIAEVSFSNSGQTIYFDGKTFKRIKGGGTYGNYRCLEDENEYWISGVKRRGSNRHRYGSGSIVDRTVHRDGA